jgi:hypothetical protein
MMMNTNTDQSVGGELGFRGVEGLVERAEAICRYEAERIELTNEPRMRVLEGEIRSLAEREHDLRERIKLAPPQGDERARRRKTCFYWAMTALLSVAGFFFAVLAFEPFPLGSKIYLYCLGLSVIAPLTMDWFLSVWDGRRVLRALALVAVLASITGLSLLAVIRGDLLREQLRIAAQEPAVVLDDQASVAPEQKPTTFYDRTVGLLQLFMVLISVAMDLAAGFALREARRFMGSGEDREKLWEKLEAIRAQMLRRFEEFKSLENESAAFASRFWRDFYASLLSNSARAAMTKLLVLVLAVATVAAQAFAKDNLSLVIAVDLTQSVAAKGREGKTEFQKNLDAVTGILATLPGGSRVTVLGITDRSFTQPSILLSGMVPEEPGYFHERTLSARNGLVNAWLKRIARLEPQSKETDLLGAFLVASELFAKTPGSSRKVLIVLSDMRQHTRALDLESPALIPEFARCGDARMGLIADLPGVEVHILGVDGAGKTLKYWLSLKKWWQSYFLRSKAVVVDYTVLRLHDSPK